MTLYKKITWLTGKQIVSKNPYHTMRMPLLKEMFPGARFIHITRSPYEVVPSTMKMWNLVAESNQMKNTWKRPDAGEVATVLRSFDDFVAAERKKLGAHQFSEVRFEDLETDPLRELKRIYKELDLKHSNQFEKNVIQFLNMTRNYKRNRYKLSDEEKSIIRKNMSAEDTICVEKLSSG
jgi:hypothetical protein